MMRRVLTFILAGGKGQRLWPLTRDRAKPAVPFGGIYRIIDFTLSNCINSGLRRIHVLIQYKSSSLQRHLRMGWNIFDAQLNEYIDVIPAQQRVGSDWYRGTADAIYQNIYTIQQERPDEVLVLAGDHIYKMNYYKMIDFHREVDADLTVGVVKVPKDGAHKFGIIDVDKNGKVLGFKEKPKRSKSIPNDPAHIYASMGIYVFRRYPLEEELIDDAKKNTNHDFGRDIIPQMVKNKRKIFAYNFGEVTATVGKKIRFTKDSNYWRDIGTIDAYHEANMDLVKEEPLFNLYDPEWPIRTYQEQTPPAKTVIKSSDVNERFGLVINSLVSSGCIINAGHVERSILSPNVRIDSHSEVFDSILMEGVKVSRNVKIKRAIIDKDVDITKNTVIGYHLAEDKKRFFVTESGIVVVAKGTHI